MQEWYLENEREIENYDNIVDEYRCVTHTMSVRIKFRATVFKKTSFQIFLNIFSYFPFNLFIASKLASTYFILFKKSVHVLYTEITMLYS